MGFYTTCLSSVLQLCCQYCEISSSCETGLTEQHGAQLGHLYVGRDWVWVEHWAFWTTRSWPDSILRRLQSSGPRDVAYLGWLRWSIFLPCRFLVMSLFLMGLLLSESWALSPPKRNSSLRFSMHFSSQLLSANAFIIEIYAVSCGHRGRVSSCGQHSVSYIRGFHINK